MLQRAFKAEPRLFTLTSVSERLLLLLLSSNTKRVFILSAQVLLVPARHHYLM